MFTIGKLAWFCPSLYEKSIPGRIVRIEWLNGKPEYITIRTKDENTISDYACKFSLPKPVPYGGFARKKEGWPSVFYDKSSNKPVLLETLRESWKTLHPEQTFKEYMKILTKSGCFVPYADYLDERGL